MRRFRAEATAAARLVHPNIIQIYFIGEDSGHHFFAMQHVEGESLADLLARRGRLSADDALTVVQQALALPRSCLFRQTANGWRVGRVRRPPWWSFGISPRVNGLPDYRAQ